MRPLLLLLLLPLFACSQGSAVGPSTALEDRALISDQLSSYAQLWDRKAAEEFTDLFTENGTMEWHMAGAAEQPPAVAGRADILEYARQAHEGRLAGRQSRHHFSGLVFEELSAESARTEHRFMVTHVVPGEPPVVTATGIYRITWRKTDDGWLMAHRKLFVDR
ncbi:MAG: nuclear transport factor 2 family protein [Acidobacteriota bacterium]